MNSSTGGLEIFGQEIFGQREKYSESVGNIFHCILTFQRQLFLKLCSNSGFRSPYLTLMEVKKLTESLFLDKSKKFGQYWKYSDSVENIQTTLEIFVQLSDS